MSELDPARPFTADELDNLIKGAEKAFRMLYRTFIQNIMARRISDVERCRRDAADTAAMLSELRYQRSRL